MHNLSRATGCAIARLLESAGEAVDIAALESEIAAFAELARQKLCLDNSSMAAAVMFAQPLVRDWKPKWKLAYTVGLILGAKFTTEGFWTVDVIGTSTASCSCPFNPAGGRGVLPHVLFFLAFLAMLRSPPHTLAEHLTDEFPLITLKRGEEEALMNYEFGPSMSERWIKFRNALIHVAVEHPLPGPFVVEQAMLPNEDVEVPLHVMIVDDSPHVRELHRTLILNLQPEARIQTCGR